MRVSKNQVTLLSTAVAALFAVGANAQVTLPGTTTLGSIAGSTALNLAQEIANGVPLGTAGIQVNTQLGIGTATAQDRYVKFTLTNATFNSNVVATNLAAMNFAPNCTGVANFTPTVAVGGLAGASTVTFQITTTASNNIGDCLRFTLGSGVNVASTAAPVNILYEVYEFLAQANASSPILYSANRNYAAFNPSVRFAAATPQPSQTATALSGFLNFNTGGTSAAIAVNIANVGNIILDTVAVNVPFLADGVTLSSIATVLAANGNTITVTGDFSAAAAAANVTLAPGGSTAANTTLAAGSVAFANVSNAAGVGNRIVSYNVNGVTQVQASSYTGSLVTTAAAGYRVLSYAPITLGTIARDGVQFESPWMTSSPGYISRIFVTQTSGNTVNWNAIVRNSAGLVTGGTLTGTLLSGRLTQLTLASLLPADPTAFPGPYQVTLNVASDATVTTGSYVLTAPAGGAVASVPLYRAANR